MLSESTIEKLSILADAAKYDVSCASSGSNRSAKPGMVGSTALPGICHSFAADGRCISLLKVLLTNACIYDCAYCLNRSSNGDVKRATFSPEEVVALTMNFYRRNYIEGLFLSSGIIKSPDYTMEQLVAVVKTLRTQERFNGYIHLKGIPGADAALIEEAGKFVDRMSINIELPTTKSLRLLAPEKHRQSMIQPIQLIKEKISEYDAMRRGRAKAPDFVPAGQSTQMIIGATPEPDYSILKISEALYNRMSLKRVYYSGYMPVGKRSIVPQGHDVILRREHRIYQADWLMRFYGFEADEILTPDQPNFDMEMDPKCAWALRNMHLFPVDIHRAPYHMLLRIPGVGVRSAQRIVKARRFGVISLEALKKMGVVLKRAKHFITIDGRPAGTVDMNPAFIRPLLLDAPKPTSLFDLYPGVFDAPPQLEMPR